MRQLPDAASKPERDLTSREIGDFRADGSWNDSARLQQRGARYRFIADLCRARLAANLSPAQIADQIDASPFAEMFGELVQWRTITRWDQWPLAWTRTSADETVKRCGVGAVEKSHWEGGTYTAGEDQRPFVSANAEHVASFVANIAERLTESRPEWAGPAVPAVKPKSDQEFFEGRET